ncbi:MAG: hypothetical protein QGG24_01370 [Vicinamibacterales bacterium]|nr:hypothetical protein [Vicinamibacterales bacterium]
MTRPSALVVCTAGGTGRGGPSIAGPDGAGAVAVVEDGDEAAA